MGLGRPRSVDRDAASSMRRARCVWCGHRIPGSLQDHEAPHSSQREQRADLRWAARSSCARHRDLEIALRAYWNGGREISS